MSASAKSSVSERSQRNDQMLEEMKRQSETRKSMSGMSDISRRSSHVSAYEQPEQIGGFPDRKSSLLEPDNEQNTSEHVSDANSTLCFEVADSEAVARTELGGAAAFERHPSRPESFAQSGAERQVEVRENFNSFTAGPKQNILLDNTRTTGATSISSSRQESCVSTTLGCSQSSYSRSEHSVVDENESVSYSESRNSISARSSEYAPPESATIPVQTLQPNPHMRASEIVASTKGCLLESELTELETEELAESLKESEMALEQLRGDAKAHPDLPEDERQFEQAKLEYRAELLEEQVDCLRMALDSGRYGDALFEQLFRIGRSLIE